MTERLCKFCGKPFPLQGRNSQKYCTKQCAGKAGKLRFWNNSPVKICAICGKKFRSKSRNEDQMTCSMECGRKYRVQNAANRKVHNEVPATIRSWADVLRVAEKFHPERFAELEMWKPEFIAKVEAQFRAEPPKESNADLYAWFYNHLLFPDETLEARIAEAAKKMLEALREGE